MVLILEFNKTCKWNIKIQYEKVFLKLNGSIREGGGEKKFSSTHSPNDMIN